MKSKNIKSNLENIFGKLSKNEKHICFLKSKNRDGWQQNFLGFNPLIIIEIKKFQDHQKIDKIIQKHLQKGHQAIIAISYDGELIINIFRNFLTETSQKTTIHFVDKNFPATIDKIVNRESIKSIKSPSAKAFKSNTTKKEYRQKYGKIQNFIKNGHIYQLNFAHQLIASTTETSPEIFQKMLATQKVGYMAYLQTNFADILCGSPEQFIKINKRNIITCPIKGTRPRGKNSKEDAKFKKELRENIKEKAELNMITDLMRNDLGKICEIGTVKVHKKRVIKAYPHIWHAHAEISGVLPPGTSHFAALMSMFPGGSITGCPKIRAMEIIKQVEKAPRGFYTGCIGFMRKDFCQFNIAIRTLIKKDQHVFLSVGGGIVIDSQMENEFQETFDKAKSFENIL